MASKLLTAASLIVFMMRSVPSLFGVFSFYSSYRNSNEEHRKKKWNVNQLFVFLFVILAFIAIDSYCLIEKTALFSVVFSYNA